MAVPKTTETRYRDGSGGETGFTKITLVTLSLHLFIHDIILYVMQLDYYRNSIVKQKEHLIFGMGLLCVLFIQFVLPVHCHSYGTAIHTSL